MSVPSRGGESADPFSAAALDARDFESRADLVLVVGPDARLLHLSAGWQPLIGSPPATLLGRPALQALRVGRLATADWKEFEHGLAAALQDDSRVPIPLCFDDGGDGFRLLEGRAYGPRATTGNLVVVFHDVTPRLSELVDMVESERRFHLIAGAARNMVSESNERGRYTYLSPVCTEVLGYEVEDLLQRDPMSILHEDDAQLFLHQLRSNPELDRPFTVSPHRLRHKDGSWVWVEVTAVRYRRPDGETRLIGVAVDITDKIETEKARRLLEDQLRRSQKLESLGILAGGIAHDFNNFLTPIVGSAGLLELELPDDSPLLRRVEMIRKAARRAADLTAQMLAYAGKSEPLLVPLDLAKSIVDMQLLLESTASHRAELVYDLDREMPLVHADNGQIGQVVMNLVANAAEALGPDGGRIEIRTGFVEADRELLRAYHLGDKCSEGTYGYVEVCDDGVGIGDEAREHIFDPFYSTKFTGRGLGLAVVLGIVRSHQGALRIESPSRGGTRFRILLPVSSGAEAHTGLQTSEAEGFEQSVRESGTFLVVDDDEGARELTTILLERAGFKVCSAAGGGEALEIFRSRADEFSCVVLDNTMPGMSGAQVFGAIREIKPDVPIILASGYSRERIPDELLAQGATCFLRKPFDATQLLAAVRELLVAS